MAIAFRSIGTGATGDNPATITPGAPAGRLSTDILIAAFGFGQPGTAVITPPSGWTLIKRTDDGVNGNGSAAYWAAGNVASLAFGISGAQSISAIVACYSGVNNATPMDATAVSQTNGVSGTVTAPSITTVTANTQLVFIGSPYDAARGNTGTWTAVFGAVRGSIGFRGASDTSDVAIADGAQAAIGASGSKTETYSVTLVSIGTLMALRPAASTFPADFDPWSPPIFQDDDSPVTVWA